MHAAPRRPVVVFLFTKKTAYELRISDWSSDVCSPDLVNQNEPAIGTQEDYPFAHRRAKVLTYTADSLTYTPDPPNYYGMIEFDGGGRMMIEFTDADPARIYVGAPVRMRFSIKAHEERSGFVKYLWKGGAGGEGNGDGEG